MSHSKWMSVAIMDVQPHMGAIANPHSDEKTTIFDKSITLLHKWFTNRMVFFPDDVFSLVMMGTEDTQYEVSAKKVPNAERVNVGLSFDPCSSEQSELFGAIEVNPDAYDDCDIRGALGVAGELILDRHALNKRLQFGKQIVLFTSLDSNESIPSTNFYDYSNFADLCTERKHIVNVYAHGALDVNADSAFTAALTTIEFWHRAVDDFSEFQTWYSWNETTFQYEQSTTPPPYKVASDDDVHRYKETGLSREQLTYILYYDYNTTTDGSVSEDARKITLKMRQKELTLRYLSARTGGFFYSFDRGERELDGPFHREKKQITKYNGKLRLGSDALIPLIDIQGFSLTLQQKLPTLASWNKNPDKGGIANNAAAITQHVAKLLETNANWKPGDAGPNNLEKIRRERIYTDDQGNPVDPTTALAGYRYGKEDIIPLDSNDLAGLNIPTSKSLSVIRVVKRDSIHPWVRCDSVDYFHGHKDSEPSQLIIQELSRYCEEMKVVLLVRYVKRDNAQALFGYLYPIINTSGQNGFIFNRLPNSDDLRLNSHSATYIPLSNDEVDQWKIWYDNYQRDYLRVYHDRYAKLPDRIEDEPKPTFEEYMAREYQQQYEESWNKYRQIATLKKDQDEDDEENEGMNNNNNDNNNDSELPLLHPTWLSEDFDDVMNHKRWAIRNRTPIGFNSSYICPLTNKAALQDNPFFGYSVSRLSPTQETINQICNQMMLPDDYNPASIRSPGLQRFYMAVKERFADHNANIGDSLQYVNRFLLPPTQPVPESLYESIDNSDPAARLAVAEQYQQEQVELLAQRLDSLKQQREVTIQQITFDWRSRRQYMNPHAAKNPLAMEGGYGTSTTTSSSSDNQMNDIGFNEYNNVMNSDVVKEEGIDYKQELETKIEQTGRVDVGIVAPVSLTTVSGISFEKPEKGFFALLSAGRVNEAVEQMIEVMWKLLIPLDQDPASARRMCARGASALMGFRDEAIELEYALKYNDFITSVLEEARAYERLKYLKQQQDYHQKYNLNIYPNQNQFPFPADVGQGTYIIHPLLDLVPKFNKENIYPITDEKFAGYKSIMLFWKQVAVHEEYALFSKIDYPKSTVQPDDVMRPFGPDPILAKWKAYDQQCIADAKALAEGAAIVDQNAMVDQQTQPQQQDAVPQQQQQQDQEDDYDDDAFDF